MRRESWLLLLPLLIYGHTLGFGFTNWDDPMLVTENPRIQSLSPALFVPRAGHSYQPVREFSYAIDHALWGLRPAGYHAVNLLLHTGAGFLLMFALLAFLNQLRSLQTEQNHRLALGVALLWALHPINTEAVVWVASRKYGLLACFAFGALWAHLCEHRKTAAALAAAALLSSPFGIVLPVLFLLVDWTRDRLEWRRYLPIGIAWIILAIPIASGLFGGDSVVADDKAAANPLTMLRVIFDYALILLWPLKLSAKYPNRVVQSLADIRIWIALAALIIAISASWRVRVRTRLPVFCLGWILIAWAPVSNLIPISTTMADRYLYLPGLGIFLAIGLGLERLRKPQLLFVLAAAFAAFAAHRSLAWRNSESLWRDAIKKDAENPVAHSNLGDTLDDQERYDEAAEHYRQCIAIYANHAPAHHNLARYHIRREEFAIAHNHASRAVDIRPDLAPAWSNIGLCELRMGKPQAAVANFAKAIELDPGPRDVVVNLGLAQLAAGDAVGAASTFVQAAESADVEFCLAATRTLVAQGHTQAALPLLRKAISLMPDSPKKSELQNLYNQLQRQ